ncbi:hypothetical protein M407DRAFT_23743 [Tulasnella calospora MUT 4182]|uniref:Uncharacterized protein n=1 Tax=Tulasnella calospora MUT 4182 TaxID=1051891 RepID=A0A0C3QA48_9AGAM|nr:hypothetical protein M407DRAFT_23743 [Tulasnella calospora MUT 4182]
MPPHESNPQLSRISTALVGAQHALHVSDASVHDLETKIADTKDEISSISSQINSLRETMAQKYEFQENLEDLLPLAIQERELASNRVRRLEQALDDLERHLTAEDWYEEEEMEEFATGHAADKYAKYLKEVGRISPRADEQKHLQTSDVPISQRVQQLALDPSFQAEGLNTIEPDIRAVRPTDNDTISPRNTLQPKDNQSIPIPHSTEPCGTDPKDHQSSNSHNPSPKTDTAEASPVTSPDCVQRPIIDSPTRDLIDLEEVRSQFSATTLHFPVAFPQNPPLPSSPEDTRSHLVMNAPNFPGETLAE